MANGLSSSRADAGAALIGAPRTGGAVGFAATGLPQTARGRAAAIHRRRPSGTDVDVVHDDGRCTSNGRAAARIAGPLTLAAHNDSVTDL